LSIQKKEGKNWSQVPDGLPDTKDWPTLTLTLKKKKLIYDRQSVGQSVLVSGAHLGPVTNFSFAMTFPLDSCGLGIL
jgi:hypothetical protein